MVSQINELNEAAKYSKFDAVYCIVAASVAIDLISQDVVGKSLPDQSGSQHVSVGKVEYHVYK